MLILNFGPNRAKFFIQLINTPLKLLDLLSILAAKSMLILNFGPNRAKFFLLSHNSLLELSSHTLQVSNCLLGKFQVSFNLSFEFFYISLGFLFTFKSILTLIQRLLKFSFNFAKMVASIFHSLNIFFSFLAAFTSTFLLLS